MRDNGNARLDWENALTECVRRANAARWQRMLHQPVRQLLPRMAVSSQTVYEKTAATFWGETFHVLLPEQVSTRIWRYGFFEEDVCRFLLRLLRVGDTFVDVGAHFGFFTCLGAALTGETGRVLSLEPTPSTFAQLQKNTRHLSSVTAIAAAAYSQAQDLTLCDYGIEYAAYNSAHGLRETDERAKQRISPKPFVAPAYRLDELLREQNFKSVRLIKIDAESAELHVLAGMDETLQGLRPAVILEVGDFDLEGVPRTKDLCEALAAFDYQPWFWQNGKLKQPETYMAVAPGNWLFLPAENRAQFVVT